MAEYGDRIFKILHQFNKRAHIPDLHSFTAKIENGVVFVECRGYEVMVESRTYSETGEEKVSTWCGTTVAAANRLEILQLDIDTISY